MWIASTRLIATLLLSTASLGISDACAADRPGVAVVELFTSEGCSSCPPADQVQSTLVEGQAKTPSEVYCLTFHVDYWDNLGWPDRFADARFTQRQRAYVRALGLKGGYTPQMVVNGQTEFVGSNAKFADRAITEAQGSPATVGISLSTKRLAGSKLRVHYDLDGDAAKSVVNVAFVETGLKTKVRRGENAGETLLHANVVRAWESVVLKNQTAGDVDLSMPLDAHLDQCRVIAFVQEVPSMRVLGATQSDPIAGK